MKILTKAYGKRRRAFQTAKIALYLALVMALSGCGGGKPQAFLQGDPKVELSTFATKTLSFTVGIKAPENSDEVVVAVWSAAADGQGNTQDDLDWYNAKYVDGAWKAVVQLDRKNYSAGYYFVHVYVNDAFYSDAFLITPEIES